MEERSVRDPETSRTNVGQRRTRRRGVAGGVRLPALVVARSHGALTPLPDLADPDVVAWHDRDGTLCAYGYVRDGQHWMLFPNFASFRFDRTGERVLAVPAPSTPGDAVRDVYLRCVLPMALQVRGQEVLHASAVRTPRGVVAFCAESEMGKSTVAYGMSLRGYPLWGDDAVPFRLSDVGVLAAALPFRVRLRPASAAFFDGAALASSAPPVVEIPPGAEEPLALLCVLRQEAAGAIGLPVSVRPLAPSRAFTAVLAHAYCFSLADPRRKREMIEQYLELTARVPTVEVRFRSGLEWLPLVLDAVEGWIDGLPSS